MSKVREVSLFISHWHTQLPSFPKGTLWNFNWHHSMCRVLMSISQTVFNSLAASLLTPTRNFKGALLWIPQSCIKNVNLGDVLTTRSRMLPNSNEDSDQSGQERRKDLTMPSACQSVHHSASFLNLPTFCPLCSRQNPGCLFFFLKITNTAYIHCRKSGEMYTKHFALHYS